jgi:chemotaxis protein CheX
MNVSYVNPFLDALVNVLATMASTKATHGRAFLKTDNKAMGDVTGIIGLAGEKTKGSLAISFSEGAILHITSRMLGETMKKLDDTVIDMVGEITNMVSGGAKKELAKQGYKFEMAIPTMVTGKGHQITHKSSGPIVVVPFKIGSGEFFVEVCLNNSNNKD